MCKPVVEIYTIVDRMQRIGQRIVHLIEILRVHRHHNEDQQTDEET